MIKIYRKTGAIKAEQFDGSDAMVEKYHIEYDGAYILPFKIETPDGWLGIKVSDWVETGVNSERWPIADGVFKKTYAELPVIPKEVAEYIKESHGYGANVYEAIDCAYSLSKNGKNAEAKLGLWIVNHSNLFARAWLDGYQVEEEK